MWCCEVSLDYVRYLVVRWTCDGEVSLCQKMLRFLVCCEAKLWGLLSQDQIVKSGNVKWNREISCCQREVNIEFWSAESTLARPTLPGFFALWVPQLDFRRLSQFLFWTVKHALMNRAVIVRFSQMWGKMMLVRGLPTLLVSPGPLVFSWRVSSGPQFGDVQCCVIPMMELEGCLADP